MAIEFKIDGKIIKIDIVQAIKLQSVLNELLGSKKEKEYIPYPAKWPCDPYSPVSPGLPPDFGRV